MFLQKLFQRIVSKLLRNPMLTSFVYYVTPKIDIYSLLIAPKNVLQYIWWLSFPFVTSIT